MKTAGMYQTSMQHRQRFRSSTTSGKRIMRRSGRKMAAKVCLSSFQITQRKSRAVTCMIPLRIGCLCLPSTTHMPHDLQSRILMSARFADRVPCTSPTASLNRNDRFDKRIQVLTGPLCCTKGQRHSTRPHEIPGTSPTTSPTAPKASELIAVDKC